MYINRGLWYNRSMDDNDRYEAFMAEHADELREKALAAVGTPCPVCLEVTPLEAKAVLPWLMCKNNHRIRPWTNDEIKAMSNA